MRPAARRASGGRRQLRSNYHVPGFFPLAPGSGRRAAAARPSEVEGAGKLSTDCNAGVSPPVLNTHRDGCATNAGTTQRAVHSQQKSRNGIIRPSLNWHRRINAPATPAMAAIAVSVRAVPIPCAGIPPWRTSALCRPAMGRTRPMSSCFSAAISSPFQFQFPATTGVTEQNAAMKQWRGHDPRHNQPAKQSRREGVTHQLKSRVQ